MVVKLSQKNLTEKIYMDEEEIGRYEELIRLYMDRMKERLGRGNEDDN